jgi:peptide/nickel transport system permease protein/peptide/nickel transport system substrate-binding protein
MQHDGSDARVFELMMRRRRFLGLLGGTAAAHALGASPAGAQMPKRGGVLKVSAPANPSSLDPYTGGSGLDHSFLYVIFDTLIEWEYETLEARPGLAESWSFADPLTLVLNLRQNVVFHDGTPFNAEAAKFNLDRGRQDQRSNIKADLVTVASVEITGPHQVALKLSQPDTALPLILSDRAGMMSSPKAVQELGREHDRKPVGTGPWKLVSFADGEKVVASRNDKYWKPGLPHLDGIEMAIIPEVATGLRSVMAGENHYVYQLQAQQRPLVERNKNLVIASGPTVYCTLLYFNYARPPFNDVRVRKAVNHALNREDFVKLTMGGVAEPAAMLLPTTHWAYDKETAKLYPHDIDKAKALLAEAGYKDGLDVSMVGYTDQNSVRRQEVLIEQFKKAGMRLRFTNGTIPETSANFFGPDKKGDGLLAAWTGRPDPSLSYSLMFLKDAYYNSGRVEVSPEITAAISTSRKSEDLEGRREAFAKVQRLVMQNALFAPLAFQFELDAFSNKVKGYKPNLLGKPKFEEVWLEG